MNKDYRLIGHITIERKMGCKEFKLHYNGSYIDNMAGPTIILADGGYYMYYESGWDVLKSSFIDRTGL